MICVGVLISKIVLRPFKSSILNVQGVVFEFILCIVIGLLTSFYNKSDEFSTTGGANFRGTLCFILVCSLMLISYIFTFILLLSNCCSKRKTAPREGVSVVPKINEIDQIVKKTIDVKNETTIQESNNIDFVRKSEFNAEEPQNIDLFEVQSKISSQNLREESKLDFSNNLTNSPSFVNLKSEHAQGYFVNMASRQIERDSVFLKAGDTSILTDDNSKNISTKIVRNFNTLRRTKPIDEEY